MVFYRYGYEILQIDHFFPEIDATSLHSHKSDPSKPMIGTQ